MAEFQTFFHGQMAGCHILCLKSFVDFGHKVIVYSYEDHRVPSFCEARPAEDLIPQSEIFTYKSGPEAGSIACFANLMRYAILYQHGGWWIDTDVLCLTESWRDDDDVALGWESADHTNVAVMKWPERHPLIAEALDVCRRLRENVIWGQTGPKLMTALTIKHGLTESIRARELYYPIEWSDWTMLVDSTKCEQVIRDTSGSQSVHLWWELHRRSGRMRDEPPPEGSFLAEAVRRHAAQRFFQSDAPERAERKHLHLG